MVFNLVKHAELGSCEKTVQYLCDTIPGLKTIKIQLDYPISYDDILYLTESALEKESSVRLVLMDAISSLPGVRFPWERVCHLCRQRGIYSLVDGAHAITQIPVDIKQSQPDFFVSNLHKWSYVPRGCAVFYVRSSLQPLIHSIPIGHGYISSSQSFVPSPISTSPEGQWVAEHEWVGTIDLSGYLSVSAAFEFIERCGGAQKIRDYCHNLAVEGGKRAAEILGTEVLGGDGAEDIASMVNVRLPLEIPDEGSTTSVERLVAQRDALLDKLFEKDCFPYPFVMTKGKKTVWWCRFSAQIYLDLEDFEQGAFILKRACEELQA
jgi:hercynylcysteine S-oxide lyase